MKNQDQKIFRLIRDLVKWISLKEIKEDDEYLNKLINKLISENKDPDVILKEISQKQNNIYGTCSIQNLKQTNVLNNHMVENIVLQKDNNYEIDI